LTATQPSPRKGNSTTTRVFDPSFMDPMLEFPGRWRVAKR
jgi:hypothetical protein